MVEPPKTRTRKASATFSLWWSSQVIGSVDHREVVAKVREEADWSAHFAFMTLMSAGIAMLGLLLSSPAVVIGAMLISPLMGPIIGLGFGLATFDSDEMRRTFRTLAGGILIAIAFCALIVLLSPLQTVTSEIAARTRPNLFDLLVALFSGLAGTYAMIRGRHGTIVGVAIATALMPPIAVMGFGLATANWTVLIGSSLLLFTNLMTIAAAAALLARIYGFAPDLSPRQTRLQATLVFVVLIALAVPLMLALRQIAWESVASRQAHETIAARFGPEARLSEIEIDYQKDPIEIAATVLAERYRAGAERDVSVRLAERFGQPVLVTIDQVRTGNGDAEAMEIAAAKGLAAADRGASRIAERLALIAGVAPERVLIDRARKRAHVRAAPLPGASLDTYRALEARVAASEQGWSVTLIPPPASPPPVAMAGGAPSPAGDRAIATAIWGARRLRLPIGVAGQRTAVDSVVEALESGGIEARYAAGPSDAGEVALRWLAPAPAEPSGAAP